jgi:hypothetical protein
MTQAGIYRHHKGGLYTVLMTALESTNGRERAPVVVYVSHQDGSINVRDEREFHEQVQGVPRFELVAGAQAEGVEWRTRGDNDWLYVDGALTSARVVAYKNGPHGTRYWWEHKGKSVRDGWERRGFAAPYKDRDEARAHCLASLCQVHPSLFTKE